MRYLLAVILLGVFTGGFREMMSANQAGAAEPQPVLLWPDDHPANAADERPTDAEPAWMSRYVTTKPSIIPYLAPYLAESESPRAAVVICPGGGYAGLSMEKEGVEVAQWMNEQGVSAFVLRYRCGGGPNQQPIPHRDAQRAIRMVRNEAQDWGIDLGRVGILGFSAGGHLASSAATIFDDGDPSSADPIEGASSRPDFAVLIYPVISMRGGVTHGGSRQNLLGNEADDRLVGQWSTDERVTDKTPPTFLVHASDDGPVPVKNSLLFYEALVKNNVPAELHVYEQGGHGFGMLRGEQPADLWPSLLKPWLHGQGVID